MDRVLAGLMSLRRAVVLDASGASAKAAGDALRQADAERRRTMKEAARATARGSGEALDVRALPDGGAAVKIGGGRPFKVPALLAQILTVLASAPPCADGFPSWLSVEEVAVRVGRKSGRTPTRHAITQGVYRLRHLMAGIEANPHLIQGDRVRGLRFLLKK
jgi:hypothetical protein